MTDIRDELGPFLLAAAYAYAEIAQQTGQWPPDSELTRRRVYELYERELAEKNGRESAD